MRMDKDGESAWRCSSLQGVKGNVWEETAKQVTIGAIKEFCERRNPIIAGFPYLHVRELCTDGVDAACDQHAYCKEDLRGRHATRACSQHRWPSVDSLTQTATQTTKLHVECPYSLLPATL